ncbi:hypothetical protein NDU88_007580 [Pleurodeles waltl]|uniref:Uncharacterized protein n=1 Tax=Pleurodeles waltl TaxID=8319 RepID=A0AAV7NWN6_PLEWA|nr:hypothetical protein NDU88_007580 [Pleurodeles waltl]
MHGREASRSSIFTCDSGHARRFPSFAPSSSPFQPAAGPARPQEPPGARSAGRAAQGVPIPLPSSDD